MVNVIFVLSHLRSKSCFCFGLRCLCSVEHVAGRNGLLTKMSGGGVRGDFACDPCQCEGNC